MINAIEIAADLTTLKSRVEASLDLPLDSEVAHLVGQTADNERSVLQWADLHKNLFSGVFSLDGSDTGIYGYPGFTLWRDNLIKRGITQERIVGIPDTDTWPGPGGRMIANTLTELQALVRFCKEQRFQHLIIVAPHFHLLRSYMTAAHVTLREYPELRIFPASGTRLRWDEIVAHSQGKLVMERADFIFTETTRIFAYLDQGNLAHPRDVLKYMDRLGI